MRCKWFLPLSLDPLLNSRGLSLYNRSRTSSSSPTKKKAKMTRKLSPPAPGGIPYRDLAAVTMPRASSPTHSLTVGEITLYVKPTCFTLTKFSLWTSPCRNPNGSSVVGPSKSV